MFKQLIVLRLVLINILDNLFLEIKIKLILILLEFMRQTTLLNIN